MAEHKKSQNSLFPDIEMNNVMGGQNGHNMSDRLAHECDGSVNPTPPKTRPLDLPPRNLNSSYNHLPHVEGDSWEEVMKAVSKYDKELCEGWNKDVDSALVFAGLFSATVTPFVTKSYKWLESPNDATVHLLSQLSQHLGTSTSTVSMPFVVTAVSIRINIFWFLSLVIALSSALIGILCKQWIREYQRDPPISHKEAFELRQLRHQSWEYWRVPDIISSTLILLQLALLLFFAGVVDLLWSQVQVTVVAVVVTVSVGLSALLILLTTVLPSANDLFRVVLRDQRYVEWNNLVPCAYRSPLSRVVLSLTRSMTHRYWLRKQRLHGDDKFRATYDWSSVDLHLLRHYKKTYRRDPIDYLCRGMKWAVITLGDNVSMIKHLFHCMESSSSVLDSLVPHALDCSPPDSWRHRVARDYAYMWFLRERRFVHEMPHLYIEATLCCIDHEPFESSSSWFWYAIEEALSQIHKNRIPGDLYLHLISTSSRVINNSDAVLQFCLQILALSWVHEDEAVRIAGARWASELESNAPAPEYTRIILHGLGRIISGTFNQRLGEVNISVETRKRIISSEPFRSLFNWARAHWHNIHHSLRSPSYVDYHERLKDEAQKLAKLSPNHFDILPKPNAGARLYDPMDVVHASRSSIIVRCESATDSFESESYQGSNRISVAGSLVVTPNSDTGWNTSSTQVQTLQVPEFQHSSSIPVQNCTTAINLKPDIPESDDARLRPAPVIQISHHFSSSMG